MSANKFEIFKEITIGGLTKEQLIQRLSEDGIQFNKYANTLFRKDFVMDGGCLKILLCRRFDFV